MKLSRLDHLVLTVSDINMTTEFYRRALGMRMQTFNDGRVALHFGQPGHEQKINLHQAGEEFEPRANWPTVGAADLCFVTQTPLPEAMQHVRDCGIEIIEGPVTRTGAAGSMTSFYFRDPDRNLIEVCHY